MKVKAGSPPLRAHSMPRPCKGGKVLSQGIGIEYNSIQLCHGDLGAHLQDAATLVPEVNVSHTEGVLHKMRPHPFY